MKIRFKDKQLISLLLIESGYSQSSFSRDLGISFSYFNQLVNGKKNPSPRMAKEIAELLNVKFNDLFETF